MKLTIAFLALLTAGCTNATKPLTGSIGHYQVYRSTAQSFSGPNVTALHVFDGTNAPQLAFAASSDGIGHPIIKAIGSAAGLVGAGAALGSTLRPSHTSVDNSSHNESWAQGGEIITR